MRPVYLATKFFEGIGLYSSAALLYLRLLARRRGILIRPHAFASSETLEFHRPPGRSVIISKRHLMYGPDIIHFFDYYFDAVEPSARKEEWVVDYSKPAWHVLKKSGLKLHFTSFPESDITTEIYLEKAAPGPGQVILDLGGYCGGSAYFLAQAGGPTCRVITLEPDSLNYESLKKNVEFHGLRNVTPLPLAIWSHSGKLRFQNEGNMGSGINQVHNRSALHDEVQGITLEELVERCDLQRIDFIKMDIEGSETVVLKSAAPLLKKFRPRLVVEPHIVAGKSNEAEVISILNGIGFESEILAQGELNLPLIFARPK